MIHALLLTQIQSYVQDSCVGNFASSHIETLEKVKLYVFIAIYLFNIC